MTGQPLKDRNQNEVIEMFHDSLFSKFKEHEIGMSTQIAFFVTGLAFLVCHDEELKQEVLEAMDDFIEKIRYVASKED
jgi:hypothetical protein